jgi:hypothetical protein
MAKVLDVSVPGDAGLLISMDEDRSKRFMKVLYQACSTLESLRASTAMFPNVGTTTCEMDPALTVTAFGELLSEQLDILLDMANNQDCEVPAPKILTEDGDA